MARAVKISSLSVGEFKAAREALEDYKKGLTNKVQSFVSRLAERGVEVAKQRAGEYAGYIVFKAEASPSQDGCKGLLMAVDGAKVSRTWKINSKGETRTVDISPLLMSEFGSGFKAQNPEGIPGVGQGTFPGQTHAFDPGGWSWMDVDGQWHHTTGMSPTMPMYNAARIMREQIAEVAREVFGEAE